MKCEICGIKENVHNEVYHQQIESVLTLIGRGYMPAMLAWTHLKDTETDGIVSARYSDGAIWIDESLLENQWRKKRISFAQWKSLIDRIRGGEPLWMVAGEDTLAGSYLRWITALYPYYGNTDHIDLKYSLWTMDFGVWMEYAPQAYDLMRIALDSSVYYEITSAPRKEIRFGSVSLRREDKRYVADVYFRTEWDDVASIADGYEVDEETYDEFLDYIGGAVPRNSYVGPGVEVTRTVTSKTFPGLMKKIDDVENQLLRENAEAAERFEAEIRVFLDSR